MWQISNLSLSLCLFLYCCRWYDCCCKSSAVRLLCHCVVDLHVCDAMLSRRFRKTGSIDPGHIGGSKPKVTTMDVVSRVRRCKADNPQMFAWEIRQRSVRRVRYLSTCLSLTCLSFCAPVYRWVWTYTTVVCWQSSQSWTCAQLMLMWLSDAVCHTPALNWSL